MRLHPVFALCLGGALLASAGPSRAATFEIDAKSTLTFAPSVVTINAGDSVTFKNTGGFHNVVADDGSFRCAAGCDGEGGSGAPSQSAWSFTRTFNSPGTFGFHCEVHGVPGSGMHGTITVNDVAAPPPPAQNIVGGLSGNWFDPTPNQAGHGFQLEILPNNGMLAIWFVFNPNGTQQNWIYSQGTYDSNSNTVTLPAFLEQGGAFPPNFDGSKISAPAWGSLQFTFSDCNSGTVAWKSNTASAAAGYGDVSFPIQRVTSLAGTTCP